MVAWKRGDAMRLERNESYWGQPPLVKRLRFQVIPEAGARIAALRAGAGGGVDAVPPRGAGGLAPDPSPQGGSGVPKPQCRPYLHARPEGKFGSGGKDRL